MVNVDKTMIKVPYIVKLILFSESASSKPNGTENKYRTENKPKIRKIGGRSWNCLSCPNVSTINNLESRKNKLTKSIE